MITLTCNFISGFDFLYILRIILWIYTSFIIKFKLRFNFA